MVAMGLRIENICAIARAATIAMMVPPIAPDQVFFGLIDGASFGPPKARPAK